MNPQVSNPNDHKVVSFHNSTDFGFTPAMGCMYDGRAINGKTGAPGIDAGETVVLPYHIAHRLATNLAKVALIRGVADTKPQVDAHGQPIVASLWDDVRLEQVKNSYLADLYTEDKPIAQSETDKLMEKVEEYKKMVDKLLISNVKPGEQAPVTAVGSEPVLPSEQIAFQDKKEVIAELEKRGVPHDKRKSKAELEKLLA